MFEYDYLTKPFNGYRFFIVGDEKGIDSVVGYVTPRGKVVRCLTPLPAEAWWLADFVKFELAGAA